MYRRLVGVRRARPLPPARKQLLPVPVRLPVTIAAVLLALAVTGFTSARLSGVPVNRPVLRNLVVGTLAMGLTYAAGTLVGTQL